jgi:hypothetical protein
LLEYGTQVRHHTLHQGAVDAAHLHPLRPAQPATR